MQLDMYLTLELITLFVQCNMDKTVIQENQKCLLMDISGENRVVAEGRWSSDDPDVTVHFVPLGHDGVRVWVDVVKVGDAEVWRSSSYIECMEDAIGSTIAWPKEKVVIV